MTKLKIQGWGWLYIQIIIDWYTKEIIGYHASLTSKASDWLDALNMAVNARDVQAPNQKPCVEAFFSNFKREEVYRNQYQNPIQAFRSWKSYLSWYNEKRPHSALGFLSPVQFRAAQLQKPLLFRKEASLDAIADSQQ